MVRISLVPVLNLLYFYISTFRIMRAVPNMAVFCSSLTSCFPGMMLAYFLNDFLIIIIIIIIIITIMILVITSVHCIYNYIPETNLVPKLHSVAAVLYLQFELHVMLFRTLNSVCILT